MEEQIERWLSSARFAKHAATLEAEFALLNDAMISIEPHTRLGAARRLSALARSELTWFLLPVREYFLESRTQQLIAESLRIETEGNTRDRMLNTLRHASERFVEHPMWSPRWSEVAHDAWRSRVHGIAASFSAHPRSSTRAEAAYLLASCDDARSWDVLLDAVRRRSSAFTMLHDAVVRYPSSITPEQRASILALCDDIGTANQRYEYDAAGIRTALIG